MYTGGEIRPGYHACLTIFQNIRDVLQYNERGMFANVIILS